MKVKLNITGTLVLIPESVAEQVVLNKLTDDDVRFNDVIGVVQLDILDDDDDSVEPANPVIDNSDILKKLIEDMNKRPQQPAWPRTMPFDPMNPYRPWYDPNQIIGGHPYTITYSDRTTLKDDGNSLLSK